MRAELVDPGHLDASEFESLTNWVRQYVQVRRPDWPLLGPVAFLESNWPRLRTAVLFRAWAAWHGRKFRGVRELYNELLPGVGDDYYAPRPLVSPIEPGLRLGETLIRLKALQPAALEDGIRIQREIEDTLGCSMLLGAVLLSNSVITVGEYYQALAIQMDEEFKGVSLETAELVRSSPRSQRR